MISCASVLFVKCIGRFGVCVQTGRRMTMLCLTTPGSRETASV